MPPDPTASASEGDRVHGAGGRKEGGKEVPLFPFTSMMDTAPGEPVCSGAADGLMRTWWKENEGRKKGFHSSLSAMHEWDSSPSLQ